MTMEDHAHASELRAAATARWGALGAAAWPCAAPSWPSASALCCRADVVLSSASAALPPPAALPRRSLHYRAALPAEALLDPAFLAAHVRVGRLQALAASGRRGRGNAAAVLPGGRLLLSLDRATFHELGLPGRAARRRRGGRSGTAAARREQQFEAEVDLRAEAFRPGRRLYERVRGCLAGRVPPLDLLVTWEDAEGRPGEVRFPDLPGVEARRVPNAVSALPLQRAAGAAVPDAEALAALGGAADHAGVCDWVGLAAARCVGALGLLPGGGAAADEAAREVAGHVGVGELRTVAGSLHLATLGGAGDGLVPAADLAACVAGARKAVEDGAADLAAVVLHRAPDAPRAWNQSEARRPAMDTHSQTVLVVLPRGRYLCYALGGDGDTPV